MKRGQLPTSEAHAIDLDRGAGALCALCGNIARGRGMIGERIYCRPLCDCHPSCHIRAQVRDWLGKQVPPELPPRR